MFTSPLLLIFDLLGTFAFAAVGAYLGIKKKFDVFGIFMAAFLSALAGGTIREVILQNVPPYFYDSRYVIAVFVGILFSIIFYRVFPRIHSYVLVADAIGLGAFAYIGAARAADSGFGAFPIIFLATLTAVGGGIVRDVALRETPEIFYRDFYASPAILLGILYAIFRPTEPLTIYLLIIGIVLLRLLAVRYKVVLWHPWQEEI